MKYIMPRIEYINESFEVTDPTITITKDELDERGLPNQTQTYSVNYLLGDIEITGSLNPYETGRDTDYSFEPDDFDSAEAEEYYDANWENIEKQLTDNLFANWESINA